MTVCGRLLTAIGLVLILTMSIAAWQRGIAGLMWCLYGQYAHVNRTQSVDACTSIRLFAGGELLTLGQDGRWRPATLLSGSRVLRRWAWLRFRTAAGTEVSELLRGNPRTSYEWRRLQVIWRHIGSTR